MMHKIILSVLLLLTVKAFAQNCDKATLIQMPGKWLKEKDNPSYGIKAPDLVKMKANLANIHNMLQLNYKPHGADADYNNVYQGGRFKPGFPLQYSYSIRIMKYACNGNTIKKDHESNTGLNVFVNSYSSLNIYEETVVGAAVADGFYALPGHVEQQKDYLKWTEEVSLGFGMDGMQTNWLVTCNNQLPFSFVTKKEFLEKKKEIVLAELAKYKDDPAYISALKEIENELKKPEREQNKPAVIKTNTVNSKSFAFAVTGDKYCRTLIKPLPSYFNLRIPPASPQFFTIILHGDQQNELSKKAIRDLEAAIDFTTLKTMLGK